jgi:hypothetical protein
MSRFGCLGVPLGTVPGLPRDAVRILACLLSIEREGSVMLTQQGTTVPVAALRGPATGAPPSRRTRRSRLPAFITEPWFLPSLLTLALGLYRSTTIVLWWDELSTLDVARRPISGILATATHVDAVHSVYYIFMHFWILLFGSSVLAVRLPSVLAMCGATVCTALLAIRLFDRRVAYTSAVIFALVPGVDRYACETRSYALVVLGSALALLALFRALERPSRRRSTESSWASPERSTSSRSPRYPRTSWS